MSTPSWPGVLAATLLLLCGAPARADWRDSLTTTPGTFAPLRPFKAHYRFGWSLLPAAEADFDLSKAKGVTKLSVTAKTVGVVRTSWRMNSESVSTMRTATLRPISLVQSEVYRSESEKTHVEYSDTKVERLRESKPAHGTPRVKTFEFPGVHDLHSAVHLIRSQRLANGDAYELVVYPSADPFLARVEVQGRTQIKAAGAMHKAIQIDLKLWKIDKDLALQPHEKFKRATLYLSDDSDRLLLKIEAEIAVGSVWCELDKIDFKK